MKTKVDVASSLNIVIKFIYLFLSDSCKYRSLLVANCMITRLFTLSIVFAL